MRIAFTSTSSQGKTTLVQEMIKKKEFKNYTTFNSVQRTLASYIPDFGTSENTTNFTQTCINGVFAYNIIQYPNQINDRSLICSFAYSKAANNVTDRDYLEKKFENIISLYDVIFYIPYELKVQADNFRSNNDDFHKKVDDIIREYIEKYKNKTKIVTISGSVEERLKKIFETLEVKENDELQ